MRRQLDEASRRDLVDTPTGSYELNVNGDHNLLMMLVLESSWCI